MSSFSDLERQYGAHNYEPLPVVLTKGKGVYVWDQEGNRYIDMMSAYSAVSHGHCHPDIVKVLAQQAGTLAIVSRAFYTDKLGVFLKKVCEITKLPKALPMNTGAEAVETAIKASRKWAYTVKGVPQDKAEIIACEGNFHGRTVTIVGMSSEPQYRSGFGPFPAGFKLIPYGDAAALEKAITPNTAAFIVEPIQGEGGINVPPAGFLKRCEELCRKNNVLLIVDEIQTGMGRTGKFLACEHDQVKPDGVVLGKALGGGLLPVSVFVCRDDVMAVFTPGDHGSTFGGNPLSATVGAAAIDILVKENLVAQAAELGDYLMKRLKTIKSRAIKNIRGKGLLVGVEIDPKMLSARQVCLKLLKEGVLSKETHQTVIRLAPPLVITRQQVDEVVDKLARVLADMENELK